MHWLSNFAMLALTGITCFLVVECNWDFVDAFFVVGGCATAIVLFLFLILFALVKPEEYTDLLRQIRVTLKSDFDSLLRVLGIRR